MMLIIIFAIPYIAWRYIDWAPLTAFYEEMGRWSVVMTCAGWGLAVVYLFQGEYAAVKQNPTLTQRTAFVVLILMSLLLAFNFFTLPGSRGDVLWSDPYQWWYKAFYPPQTQAFYGLMFLYLCSASYRMLRARSLESTILLVAGVLYLMRSSSMFQMWFPPITEIGEWIMNYPNKGATYGAFICATFGQMLIATRQMLGRERTAIEVA